MNEIKSSWSFVEISPEARDAAERSASAAGMDLDAWLAQLIKYTSSMELKTGGSDNSRTVAAAPPPKSAPAAPTVAASLFSANPVSPPPAPPAPAPAQAPPATTLLSASATINPPPPARSLRPPAPATGPVPAAASGSAPAPPLPLGAPLPLNFGPTVLPPTRPPVPPPAMPLTSGLSLAPARRPAAPDPAGPSLPPPGAARPSRAAGPEPHLAAAGMAPPPGRPGPAGMAGPAGDRGPAAPVFPFASAASRPSVTTPQRPAAYSSGLSLRPASSPPGAGAATAAALPAEPLPLAETLPFETNPAGLVPRRSAPPTASPAADPAGGEPFPAARPARAALRPRELGLVPAAEAPPPEARTGDRPPPAAAEPPRIIATDNLQPSRFAALSSPREDDIQGALDRWRASGMLEPLIARPRAQQAGLYEIISGIDRWHAARRAYVRQIPVVVREATDQEALELGLVDQLRRGPLSPLTEANIYLRLLNDAGLDTERVARLVGKPAAHVASLVRILNLPKPVRALLEKGDITVMHARALLEAPHPEAIARDIVDKRLDIYQTEQLVRLAGRSAEMVDVRLVADEPQTDGIGIDADAAFAGAPNLGPALPRTAAARAAPQPAGPHPAAGDPALAPAAPPTRWFGTERPAGERQSGEPERSDDSAPRPPEPEARPPLPASARRPSEARLLRETDVISTDLLERNVANALGIRCAISEKNGVGVITLHYTSREELVRILGRINNAGAAE